MTTIYFAEDDEVLAQVLQWRLQKLGYTVVGSAPSGEAAIDGIERTKPDLVILDIELKGDMDGIQVGEHLSKTMKIPFIYLTSHTEEDFIQRAKKTGPKGYVRKPLIGDELRVALTMAL